MRTAKGQLEQVIDAGIRTVLYDGDVDFICNYQGVEDMIDSLNYKYSGQYTNTPWAEWTVDGVTTGQFKNAGNFSYVRVYKFVLRLHASRSKLTSSLLVLVTLSLHIPPGTSPMESTPSRCSTRR